MLKRISPERIIYTLSDISIHMFMDREFVKEFPVTVTYGTKKRTALVAMSAWDVQSIEFLSICNSNDFRKLDKSISLGQIVDQFRIYENEHSIPAWFHKSGGAFEYVFGITMEQFLYQNQAWIYEMYNRNFHILFASPSIRRNLSVNIDTIIQETFNCSLQEYNAILLMVFWLCTQHPDPLSAPESLYTKKEDTALTKENIARFVDYYSCTYTQLRDSSVGKQLLYSKPFIRTDRNGRYLSSNCFLIAMIAANGMYWLIRDYYKQRNSHEFLNAFGLMFEDYVCELAHDYCEDRQWQQISPGSKKGADFLFDFGTAEIMVEAKSALISILGKQQVPEKKALDKFRADISEAYEQLMSSLQKRTECNSSMKPIMRVILLYEDITNLGIAEMAIGDLFENDKLLFLATIAELEIMLYLLKHEPEKLEVVMSDVLDNQCVGPYQRKNLTQILSNHSLYKTTHFKGDRDYFRNAIHDLERELKQ